MLPFFLITYFLVISSRQTKLEWYDVPMYPILALVIALPLSLVFTRLSLFSNPLLSKISPFVFLGLVFLVPYKRIFQKTYTPEEYFWNTEFYELGYYLKEALKGKHDLNNSYLFYNDYHYHNEFYIRLLRDKGVSVSLENQWKEKELSKGDRLFTHQQVVKDFIEENYKYDIVSTYKSSVVTYQINGHQ